MRMTRRRSSSMRALGCVPAFPSLWSRRDADFSLPPSFPLLHPVWCYSRCSLFSRLFPSYARTIATNLARPPCPLYSHLGLGLVPHPFLFAKIVYAGQSIIPFAVVGSESNVIINGAPVRGRKNRWGVVNVEDPNHCEFLGLRNFLTRFVSPTFLIVFFFFWLDLPILS